MKVVDRITGKVEDVSDEEAAGRVSSSEGTVEYATPEESKRQERNDKYGSTGEQALGALEEGTRAATFGLVPGFGSDEDIKGRRETLNEESPGVALGAQVTGALVPGLVTGGLAGAAAEAPLAAAADTASEAAVSGANSFKEFTNINGAWHDATRSAASIGRQVGGTAGSLAEGTTFEREQADQENRPVSVGNILLYGLGGELVGRALPAVLRRGIGSALSEDALGAIAGDTGENLGVRAETRSFSRAAQDAADMPAGPERDAFLSRTAKEQYDSAAVQARKGLDNGTELFNKSSDVSPNKIRDMVAPDASVQLAWQSTTAQDLFNAADHAGGKLGSALEKSAQDLLESTGSADTFMAARAARQALNDLPASDIRDAAITSLRQGTERVDLWGRAAEMEQDLNRTADKLASAQGDVQQAFGQGDTFDPAKIRKVLQQDKVARSLIEEKTNQYAQALQDRAQVHQKYGTAGKDVIDGLNASADSALNSFKLADEVQAASGSVKTGTAPSKIAPRARKLTDHLLSEGVETMADMALAHAGIPPVAGLAMGLMRNIDINAKQTIASVARRVIRPLVNSSGAPVRGLLAETAMSRFQGDFPGPRESFEAKKDLLFKAQEQPGALAQAISESFGSLPKENPQLFGKITARIGQALSYVTLHLPSSVATSILYPRGIPPSHDSLREFAVLWNSSMHPETVLQDLEHGVATPQQINILRDVHPDVHSQLMDGVVNEVANNFGEIDSQTKAWLDILFDSDGIAGPGFSSKAAQYIQDSAKLALQGKAGRPAGTGDLQSTGKPAAGLNALSNSVTNKGA